MTTNLITEITIDGEQLRTALEAQRKIVDISIDMKWYGSEHPSYRQWVRDIEALVLSVTVTTGEQQAQILRRLRKPIYKGFARRTWKAAEQVRLAQSN